MCGIVGICLKNPELRSRLGEIFSPMLIEMSERGPDSAGVAAYRDDEAAIGDLDGFYTFAVGTREGFSVLSDPIACKPAVLAETDDWVAISGRRAWSCSRWRWRRWRRCRSLGRTGSRGEASSDAAHQLGMRFAQDYTDKGGGEV